MHRREGKRKKPKSRLRQAIEQHRRDAAAGSNLSNITAMLANFEMRIEALRTQIRIDDREIGELEKQLIPLRKKRDEMLEETKDLKEFVRHFDKNIGPFNDSYDNLQKGLRIDMKSQRGNMLLESSSWLTYMTTIRHLNDGTTPLPQRPSSPSERAVNSMLPFSWSFRIKCARPASI
eukprot:jgi/Bigna1/89903/estExt_fgenesh1_pg.C_570113